jgi:hypothetical protein
LHKHSGALDKSGSEITNDNEFVGVEGKYKDADLCSVPSPIQKDEIDGMQKGSRRWLMWECKTSGGSLIGVQLQHDNSPIKNARGLTVVLQGHAFQNQD